MKKMMNKLTLFSIAVVMFASCSTTSYLPYTGNAGLDVGVSESTDQEVAVVEETNTVEEVTLTNTDVAMLDDLTPKEQKKLEKEIAKEEKKAVKKQERLEKWVKIGSKYPRVMNMTAGIIKKYVPEPITSASVPANVRLLSVLAFSFGIGSWFLPYLGFALALAALVLGILALVKGASGRDKAFAIVGIVFGAIGVLLFIVLWGLVLGILL